MTPASVPAEDSLPDCVSVEVSAQGGHIGFIDGGPPWRPSYYLPRRIIEFLDARLAETGEHGRALPGL